MRLGEAWRIARRLSFREALGAARLCMLHPRYVVPTWRATKRTVELCNMHYPGQHHLHNKANAIRHALWNVLIAKYCAGNSPLNQRILNWTETITDRHERFSVNPPLERAMDLHNNAVGRSWSREMISMSEEKIISRLSLLSQQAVVVSKLPANDWSQQTMVYIRD